MRARTVLSIAGSDPSGGAGIQADLKTFRDLGVYGMAAITALTVQDTRSVHRVVPIPPDIVREQVLAVLADVPVDAVKIGMLGRAGDAVAEALAGYAGPIVLDPVLVAKDGTSLADAIPPVLLARCALVTPNADEAHALGPLPVPTLLKGGHLPGDIVTDTLIVGERRWRHRHRRAPFSPHGTGCTLAAAIAARLALGDDLPTACRRAVRYVSRLVDEPGVGLGRGNPPLLHGVRAR